MKQGNFSVNDLDKQVVDLYADFLPEKVFDAHVHLYRSDTIPHFYGSDGVFFRQVSTPEDYLVDMGTFLPGVESLRMNMMPMPDPVLTEVENRLRKKANGHIVNLLHKHTNHVGSAYILPADDAETIAQIAMEPGIRGLKCYAFGAGKPNWNDLSIGEYLPEAAWEVSAQLHIPIFLHLMRPEALSDPENFSYITQMSHQYPEAKLVLAHCARAFAAWTGVRKIRELEDQGNIWFDLSAICESGPMIACILKNAGKRTMWGSDYPVCMNRGRAVSLATGQNWLMEMGDKATRIVAENLLALHQTSDLLNLDQTQIQDIFYNNAVELFLPERNDEEKGRRPL